MARSAATAAAAVFLAILLVASPQIADAITCSQVASAISPCIPYVKGSVPTPPAKCCSGVRNLKASATTKAIRQTICNCLKQLAGSTRGVKPGLISGLPGKCGVSLPFTISSSTDCSKIP